MDFEAEFADVLDHVAKVGRPATSESDVTKSYAVRAGMTVLETAAPFSFQEIRGSYPLTEIGPIEHATHKAFTGAGRAVEPGDVIQPISGNETGKFFTVGRVWRGSQTGSAQLVLEESADEKAWYAANNW